MITFPPEFVKIRYPGYFWNTKTKQLCSIKVGGIVRPLAFSRGFRNGIVDRPPGYQVSVNGVKRTIPLATLMGLKPGRREQVDVES